MKKLALLMALLLFILPVTANAATPRYVNIRPGIDFDGTMATCTVSVTGNSMKDEIEIVVKFEKWYHNQTRYQLAEDRQERS